MEAENQRLSFEYKSDVTNSGIRHSIQVEIHKELTFIKGTS